MNTPTMGPFWGQINNFYPIPSAAPNNFVQALPVPLNALHMFSKAKTKEEDHLGPRPDPTKTQCTEVREKAEYLLWMYPDISAMITRPLMSWSELYTYFSPSDVTADGAAHLWHVIGLIATYNVCKSVPVVGKLYWWALQNKQMVLAGHPLPRSAQLQLNIHDQEMILFGEVLAMTLNLLVLEFKWDEKQAVRRACFLNPPVCSSTPEAPKEESLEGQLDFEFPALNPGHIIPLAEGNHSRHDSQCDASSSTFSSRTASSSLTVIKTKSSNHNGEQNLTGQVSSHTQDSQVQLEQTTAFHDERRFMQQATRADQNPQKSRFKPPQFAGTAIMQNPQTSMSAEPFHGSPIYVKSTATQHPQRSQQGLYDPNGPANQQKNAKLARGSRSGSQSKATSSESNDARVYYGVPIGTRCYGSQIPLNNVRSVEFRPRASSIAAGVRSEHRTVATSDDSTIWTAGFKDESIDTLTRTLHSFFSECGEIISVKVKDSTNGKGLYAFVEFNSSDSARSAICRFDQYHFSDGRILKVNLRQPRAAYIRDQQPTCRDGSLRLSSMSYVHEEDSAKQRYEYSPPGTTAGGNSQPQFQLLKPPRLQTSNGQNSRLSSTGTYTGNPFESSQLPVTQSTGSASTPFGDWVTAQSRTVLGEQKRVEHADQWRSGRFQHVVNSKNSKSLTDMNESEPGCFETCATTKNKLDRSSFTSDSSTLVGSSSDGGTADVIDQPRRRNYGSLRTASRSPDLLEPIDEMPLSLGQQAAIGSVNTSTGPEETSIPLLDYGVKTQLPAGSNGCSPPKSKLPATASPSTPQKRKKSNKPKNKKVQGRIQVPVSSGELSPDSENTGSIDDNQKICSARTLSHSSTAMSFCDTSSSDSSPSNTTSRTDSCPRRTAGGSSSHVSSHHRNISDRGSEGTQAQKTTVTEVQVNKTNEDNRSCSAHHKKNTSYPDAGNEHSVQKTLNTTKSTSTRHIRTPDRAVKQQSTPGKLPSRSPKSADEGTRAFGDVNIPITTEHKSRKATTPKNMKNHGHPSAGSPMRKLGINGKGLHEKHSITGADSHSTSPGSESSKTVNNKENELLVSPVSIMSDPSQWPALGCEKSAPETKAKVMVEPLTQSASDVQLQQYQQGSMASAIYASASSQYQARCETDCTEVSKSFPPIVKWAQHKGSGKSAG